MIRKPIIYNCQFQSAKPLFVGSNPTGASNSFQNFLSINHSLNIFFILSFFATIQYPVALFEIKIKFQVAILDCLRIFYWYEFGLDEIVKLFQNYDMIKLFQISFLIILLASSSPELFAQEMSDTSRLLVKFNEPMSRDGIFNTDNYTIFRDDKTQIAVYKVGIVAGDTAVMLYTEKYVSKSSYKLIVNNLRDKAGNIISENHKLAFY